MPCTESFEEQSPEYKNSVLPKSITKRLVIEAGVRFGWDRYAGPEGDVVSMDRFGASAPGDRVLREFGFNVDNVLQRAKQVLGQ